MKKRIILSLFALMMLAGCSNGGETSVSEPESKAESSTVSVAESAEVSEKSDEISIKESSVESRSESSKKESSVESKSESSKEENSAESKAESKTESKAESKPESKVESKPESRVESKPESRVESKPESSAESKPESSVESKPESSNETSVIPATNKELVGFYNLTELNTDGENVVSMKHYNTIGMYVTLEINAGGTGIFSEYSEKKNITWNDKYINLGDYDEMEYSISGDSLALYQDEMTLVFEKTDKEALRKKMEERSKAAELSGEIDSEAVGDYILKGMDIEDAFEFDGDVYLTLHNDGTGYLESEGEQLEITWDDGEIKLMEDIFYYTKEGTDIIVDFYGVMVTFGRV